MPPTEITEKDVIRLLFNHPDIQPTVLMGPGTPGTGYVNAISELQRELGLKIVQTASEQHMSGLSKAIYDAAYTERADKTIPVQLYTAGAAGLGNSRTLFNTGGYNGGPAIAIIPTMSTAMLDTSSVASFDGPYFSAEGITSLEQMIISGI